MEELMDEKKDGQIDRWVDRKLREHRIIHRSLEKKSYCTCYLKINICSFFLETKICCFLPLSTRVRYSQCRKNWKSQNIKKKKLSTFHHEVTIDVSAYTQCHIHSIVMSFSKQHSDEPLSPTSHCSLLGVTTARWPRTPWRCWPPGPRLGQLKETSHIVRAQS